MASDDRHIRRAYTDFIVRVNRRSGGRGTQKYYLVDITSPVGEKSFRMQFSVEPFQSQLEGLEGAVFRSGDTTATRPKELDIAPLTLEQREAKAFGEALFTAVFPTDEARGFYRDSLKQLDPPNGLRIRLQIEAPDLETLPWELLHDPEDSNYAGLRIDTPVVRDIRLPRSREPLKVAPPLRILVMIASPKPQPGQPELNVADERRKIEKALAEPCRRDLVEITWLDGQTVEDLQRALRDPIHIFHFVGHGGVDPNIDGGYILLADDSGEGKKLPARQLAGLLHDAPDLRLAVLNSCDTARGGGRDHFASSASILVGDGEVPAVLAMQYAFSDDASRTFAGAFYGAIADRLPVDAAVTEARKAVSLQNPRSLEWATPVLIQRSPDGVLFDLQPKPPWWQHLPQTTHLLLTDKRVLFTIAALVLTIVGIAYYLRGPGSSCRSIRQMAGSNGGHFIYAADLNGSWQVYGYNFASCTPDALTAQSPGANRPALSHSGEDIAYLVRTKSSVDCWKQGNQLWLMKADSAENRRLNVDLPGLCNVLWSANDQSLNSIDGDRKFGLGNVPIAGGPVTREGPPNINYAAIAANGSMAYTQTQRDDPAKNDIYLLLPDGTPIAVATDSNLDEDFVSINPDGQRVAYQVNRMLNSSSGEISRQINVFLGPDESQVPMTTVQDDNFNPVWSPNGQAVAYVHKSADKKFSIWVRSVPPGEQPAVELNLGEFQPDQISFLSWQP